MKSSSMAFAPLILLSALIGSGCIEDLEDNPAQPTSTTLKPIPETPSTSYTTTSTTLETSTTSTSTTSSTTSTTLDENSCVYYCRLRGYESGFCRRSQMECTLNSEVYDRAGSRYCYENRKYDTCCCTNETTRGNVTVHYRYQNWGAR